MRIPNPKDVIAQVLFTLINGPFYMQSFLLVNQPHVGMSGGDPGGGEPGGEVGSHFLQPLSQSSPLIATSQPFTLKRNHPSQDYASHLDLT